MINNLNDIKLIKGNNALKKIILWSLLLCIAYILSLISVHGISSKYLGLVIALFTVLFSYLFWRKAILALFIWVLFSGVVRKWLLPELADVIFFFNQVILLGVYIGYFGEKLKYKSSLVIKHPVNVFIAFPLFWGVACAFNPQLPSPIVGILGFIVHFYYIPMIFIVPEIFKTKEELINCIKTFVLFSIPILLLGVIQFFSPLDSSINKYVTETDVIPMGDFPRISSTFSFIGGYASYLHILILTLIYLLTLGLGKSSTKLTALYLILLGFSVLNLFMTGSRSAMLFTILAVSLYLLISGFLNFSNFKRYILRISLAAIFLLLIAISPVGRAAINAFLNRFDQTDEITTRVSDIYNLPINYFNDIGFYGFGIGSTYQGSFALMKLLDIPSKGHELVVAFEEEPAKMLVELGLVGFIMVYLLRFVFIKFFWDLYRKLKDENLKNLALISALFILPFFINVHKLVYNHTAHVFYWFVVGFLFLLPKLDQQDIKNVKV